MVPAVDDGNADPAKGAAEPPRPLTHRIANAVALLVTGVWGVSSLLMGSNAGLTMGAGMWLVGGFFVLMIGWLISLRRSARPAVKLGLSRRARRYLAPLFVAFCALTILVGLPFRIRFALSEDDLQQYAQEVTKSPPPWGLAQPVPVGLFDVQQVEVLPKGVVRMITTTCGLDDCGIVYSPNGPPPVVGEDSYTEIGGGWWTWLRSW